MFSKQSKTTQVRDIVNEKLWSNTKLIFQEQSQPFIINISYYLVDCKRARYSRLYSTRLALKFLFEHFPVCSPERMEKCLTMSTAINP